MSDPKQQAIETHRQTIEALTDIGTSIAKHIQTIHECDRVRNDPSLVSYHVYQLHAWADSIKDLVRDLYQITEEQAQKMIAFEKQIERIDELTTLPYREYLQTPEWRERRFRILERDGNRCQVCNSSNRLNVHHRDYTRRGYENDSDLTTLCQECHRTFHENGRLVRVEV